MTSGNRYRFDNAGREAAYCDVSKREPMKMRLFMAFVAMVGLAQAGDFDALRWRNLGPNRGGRSLAVAGSVKRPLEYYFGAVGGGLWKTTNGGINWFPVTDGQIHSSSVGAVAVSES